jgi:hypothetical protein
LKDQSVDEAKSSTAADLCVLETRGMMEEMFAKVAVRI